MRKSIVLPAIALVVLAALAMSAAPMAKYEARKKAAEAGYELEVRETRVGLWTVYLDEVRLSGPSADMRAKEVRVRYDGHLRVTSVTAVGADVTVKRGKEAKRTSGRGLRPDLSLESSTVRTEEGGAKTEARVWTAKLDAEGRVWAKADVSVSRGGLSVSAKGVIADGVRLGGPMEVQVKDIVIRQSGGEEGEAATAVAKSEIPLVQVSAETVSFENEWLKATAEDVEASIERTQEREKLSFSAMYMKSSGARASGVMAKAERSELEPGTTVSLHAESLETEDSRLSSAEFSLRKVEVSATVKREGRQTSVRMGTAKLGTASADFSATLSPSEFKASVEMPEVECQQLLFSLPKEMVPRVREATLTGTIQWRTEIYVDLPGRKRPDISIWMKNRCVVKKVPEDLDVKLLKKPFLREVYSANGDKKRELAGPGTPAWTSLNAVSQFMPAAVMAMEDPSFMSHRGIVLQAIENSMEQNISAGKFVRGGSTISMQLAKNLWLAREKTISRKVQEAFLTTYLEQSLTKSQMIELYLNVVEFGPDLYGIGPASRKYFAKDPSTLTLSQSLFLASLLPSPKSSGYEEGKQVSSGRLGLLRKVMKMMLDRGTISGAQYEQGLQETPVFGEPSPMGGAEEVTSQEGIDPSEWK